MVAIAIRNEVDEQVAFGCVPCKIANELNSSTSNLKREGGTVFDELTSLCVVGVLCIDQSDRLAADLTVDASDRGLMISSQVFGDQKTVDTIVDEVDVDTLTNLERQRQETGESWWDANRNEAFLDRKLFPGKWWSRLGLSKDREERSGSSSSLCWGDSRHTRPAGDQLVVWVLGVDAIVGQGDS